MKRSVQNSVRNRIAANRQRRADSQKDRAMLQNFRAGLEKPVRILVQQVQPEPNDIVGQYAASVIRVQRID
jgi:hypothetical protein